MCKYLIIGGVPKAATTSMFRYLTDHPQVCPANQKETYFFAREFDLKGACQVGETMDNFNSYFTHCKKSDQWRVEGTPYTLYSKESAKRIKTLLPDATILFILREPISRLYSDYHFHIQRDHLHIQSTFDEFVEKQLEIKSDAPSLLELGCYVEYIRQYYAHFRRSKVQVMFLEEVKENPKSHMQNLCEELGIEKKFYDNYNFRSHNQTINVRFKKLNQISMRLEPIISGFRKRLMQNPKMLLVFEKLILNSKRLYFLLNHQRNAIKSPPSISITTRLESYYHPYNRTLANELGRPLPWKSYQQSSE